MTKKPISCPHCGKKNTWLETNTFRPFCSERCKIVDLGKWADESYRIPTPDTGQDTHQDTDSVNERENQSEDEKR